MARTRGFGAIPFVIAAGALFAFTMVSQGKAAAKPGDDKYPNGCVSCHVKGDKDRRISMEMKEIKGHPNVAGMTKVVPKDCGMCHKKGPKPPSLMNAVHKVHAKEFKFAAADFGKKPDGACMNCHKMDGGKVTVKSGPKNW